MEVIENMEPEVTPDPDNKIWAKPTHSILKWHVSQEYTCTLIGRKKSTVLACTSRAWKSVLPHSAPPPARNPMYSQDEIRQGQRATAGVAWGGSAACQASAFMLTCYQLVLFHRRQVEHIIVFPSVCLIKGFNVNGELLHKGAGEPERKNSHWDCTLEGL